MIFHYLFPTSSTTPGRPHSIAKHLTMNWASLLIHLGYDHAQAVSTTCPALVRWQISRNTVSFTSNSFSYCPNRISVTATNRLNGHVRPIIVSWSSIGCNFCRARSWWTESDAFLTTSTKTSITTCNFWCHAVRSSPNTEAVELSLSLLPVDGEALSSSFNLMASNWLQNRVPFSWPNCHVP